MAYARLRFAVTLTASMTIVLLLVSVLLSTQLAMAALPLADVTGIGGVYLSANSFQGEDAMLYPVEGENVGAGDIDADTPVCESRPMIAIELDTAEVDGFEVRKDVQLPHLENRWMTIELSQARNGQIEGDGITLYTTQLQVDTLDIRNIVIREGRPEEGGQSARVDPQDQNIDEVSQDKFGEFSSEFYLEGGEAPNDPGLVADGAEAWLHGITGEGVVLESSTGAGIEVDISFPTNAEVEDDYDSKLGYSGEESGSSEQRDNYFDCVPVEVQ